MTAATMSADDEQGLLSYCYHSLAAFGAAFNPKYTIATHIKIMCDMLQRLEQGIIDRGQIWMPPRHSKSQTATINFIAWFLGRNPDKKVILACHSQKLANKFGVQIRNIIKSKIFQAIFPNCIIDKSESAKNQFRTTLDGEFFASGIGSGSATGFGADLFVIDDPIKDREQAFSEVQRESIFEYYRAVALTRLQPEGRILITNTRWHASDLSGWLLDPTMQEEVDNWEILKFPAIATEDQYYKGKLWRREGEVLWPKKEGKFGWTLDHMMRVKKGKGQWDWSSQYQQNPADIEGVYILRKWIREYDWNPFLVTLPNWIQICTQPYRLILSLDTALKDDEKNDYSVGICALDTPSGIYILNVWRQKVIFPILMNMVIALCRLWQIGPCLIEDKASGTELGQNLRFHTGINVIMCQPRGKKTERAQATSHYWAAGRVFLPVQAPWKKDFIDELVAFPTAPHDDQMDAMSQLLQYVSENHERNEKFQAWENQHIQEMPDQSLDDWMNV